VNWLLTVIRSARFRIRCHESQRASSQATSSERRSLTFLFELDYLLNGILGHAVAQVEGTPWTAFKTKVAHVLQGKEPLSYHWGVPGLACALSHYLADAARGCFLGPAPDEDESPQGAIVRVLSSVSSACTIIEQGSQIHADLTASLESGHRNFLDDVRALRLELQQHRLDLADKHSEVLLRSVLEDCLDDVLRPYES
jgi:hypothetical protein